MKTTLVVSAVAATLGLAAVSYAQEPPRDRPEARRPMARMAIQAGIERQLEELNLTEEQRREIEPILQDLREKIRQANADAQERIGKLLTPEQRGRLENLRRQGPAGGPDRPGMGMGGMGGDAVERMRSAVRSLDLTAEQRGRIDEILGKFQRELAAARERHAGDREAMMEATRPLLRDLREQVLAVLTQQQREKLREQLEPPRRERGDRADRPERPERPQGREREQQRERRDRSNRPDRPRQEL